MHALAHRTGRTIARWVTRSSEAPSHSLASPLPWILAISFVVDSVYALSRHHQFLTAGYDLGIFDQAVRAYSRFEPPYSPLKGIDFTLLADHFHPILVVLAPLYWVWDDPRVLLIAQAALVTAALVPMWRFGRRRFGAPGATAIVIGLAFGWPTQRLIDFDFHEVAFATPLLAWAIDALDRRADRELLVALALLLLVREDMGAVVASLGVVYAIVRRRPLRGLLLSAVGLAVFVVVVTVLIPAVGGRDYAYWDYSTFGTDMASSVSTVLTDPGLVVSAFFTPFEKTETLLRLLAPLLLLPLLSPISIAALPILIERFLSDRSALWGTDFHYNAPVWVVLCFAAVDGLARLRGRLEHRRHGVRRLPAAALAVIGLVPLAASTALAPVSAGAFPLARLATGDAFRWSAHMSDQAAILRSIPPSTCVVADDRMAAQLTRTNRVTIPSIDGPAPDYLLFDLAQPQPSSTDEGWTSRDVVRLASEEGYSVIERRGDLVLLSAPGAVEPSTACAG